MIFCESARQTVHLYYSIIKFVSFKGIVWEGEGLPLVLNSLGDLFQAQVDLKDQEGNRQRDARWEMGMLRAFFESGKVYDLALRLEYHPPLAVEEFRCDFNSIHPKTYQVGLDFSFASLPPGPHLARVALGEASCLVPLERDVEEVLPSGHRVQLIREGDYGSVKVSLSSDAPFAHRFFPNLAIVGEDAKG